MMLPLSTIEGKDIPTEEVKTKPPEKGGERPLGGKLWAGGVGRVSRAGLGGKGWPCSLAPAPASPSGSSWGGRAPRGTQDGAPHITGCQWVLLLPGSEAAGVSPGSWKPPGLLFVAWTPLLSYSSPSPH